MSGDREDQGDQKPLACPFRHASDTEEGPFKVRLKIDFAECKREGCALWMAQNCSLRVLAMAAALLAHDMEKKPK